MFITNPLPLFSSPLPHPSSHVAVPLSYLTPNWPLVHTSVNPNGVDIVVAGTRGLAVYSRTSGKWRLFGNISQEREVACRSMCWVHGSVIVCCSALNSNNPASAPKPLTGARVGITNGPLPSSSSSSLSSLAVTQQEKCELLFFPKYHLDQASLLCRHALPQVGPFRPHRYFVVSYRRYGSLLIESY